MVFSRDVLKLVANLLLLDAFNQGLLIVIAFGTILYLGVDYFGVVQYFTAVGAFPRAFYNHFTLNDTTVRTRGRHPFAGRDFPFQFAVPGGDRVRRCVSCFFGVFDFPRNEVLEHRAFSDGPAGRLEPSRRLRAC